MTLSLAPPSTLVMGGAGAGKTYCLTTLMQQGIKLRLLATEPSAPNRIVEVMREKNIPLELFDWVFVSPAVPSWDNLKESAKIVNTMTLKEIAEYRGGIAKPDSAQWNKLINTCANFISDKDGKELGDVTEWGPTCTFAIDNLTGWSIICPA